MELSLAEREAAYLLEQIKQHVDPKDRKSADKFAPTALVVYGVKVPKLRKIAKTWYRAHKEIARDDVFALVEALWAGGSREERAIAFHLSEHYSRWVPDLPQARLDRWRRDLDSWVETDSLGWMLASWLMGDPDTRMDYVWELIADEDVWSRRLALVPLARINRGKMGDTFPDLTLQLVDRVKEERHPMITKVISWVLRELTKTHRDQVAAYLEENRDTLAKHVIREVDNKLRTGLKSGKRTKDTV
ncbi:MAG: DNA alkylation repair protein [Chloroflexi bacterium]|nr:DNA alkylation repair protein [Chloroflexota bacterium]